MSDQMLRAREYVERHLTKGLVWQIRNAVALKTLSFNLKPSQLIAVIKIDEKDNAFWSVEQRFGFPYEEIQERTIRRLVWEALETKDADDELRVLFLDVKNTHASSLRIAAVGALS